VRLGLEPERVSKAWRRGLVFGLLLDGFLGDIGHRALLMWRARPLPVGGFEVWAAWVLIFAIALAALYLREVGRSVDCEGCGDRYEAGHLCAECERCPYCAEGRDYA